LLFLAREGLVNVQPAMFGGAHHHLKLLVVPVKGQETCHGALSSPSKLGG
jgi:hypothetical protein